MRSFVLIAVSLGIFALTSPASAQSLFEQCQEKKADIEQMKQQAQGMDVGINDLTAQINELEQKRRELNRDKLAQLRAKGKLEKRIKLDSSMMKRMCVGLAQCDAFERRIEKLKERMAPLVQRLHKIRAEIQTRQSETNNLYQKTQRIETSYQQLNCDNLVPGQTAQSTIDRCTELFSQWNETLKEINTLQASVSSLRSRYQRVMRKMRIISTDLARLLKKMRKSCQHSQRLVDLENMDKEQKDYQGMKKTLEVMTGKFQALRKLKIRRPKIKLMKIRPGLKPAKKNKRPALKRAR